MIISSKLEDEYYHLLWPARHKTISLEMQESGGKGHIAACHGDCLLHFLECIDHDSRVAARSARRKK
jgi:hypothetical protein